MKYLLFLLALCMLPLYAAPKEGPRRDYNILPTEQDKQNIKYIVKTLSTTSLLKLKGQEGALKKVGDRIDHVHPLRFLEVLFSNEEMKAYAHAVRGRTFFVWGEFFGGLKNSLQEESVRGNMTDAQIAQFSKNVGVPVASVQGLIKNRQWQQLYDTLLKQLPRKGNTKKFNM